VKKILSILLNLAAVSMIWTASAAQPSPGDGVKQPMKAGNIVPVVEAEDIVYNWQYVDWGATPLWCYGNTCIIRIGNDVFADGLEGALLGRSRWTLFQRGKDVWQLMQKDTASTTREPCPFGCFPDTGRIFLSHSPVQRKHRPEVLEFADADPKAAYKTLLPWGDRDGDATTYRTFSVDGPNREMIVFHNAGYSHANWSFCDRAGKWSARGRLDWCKGEDRSTAPYGAVYARANYPTVMLKDRAVHFAGAAAWNVWAKVSKDENLMGRRWGNRWRRLFYTWTPDVTKKGFSEWITIGSTHETGGWLFPGDLWVDDTGAAHVAWSEAPINEELRDKHFPDIKRVFALKYAQIKDGKVVLKTMLLEGGEGKSPEIPGHPGKENFIKLKDPSSVDGYLLSDQAGRGQPRLHVTPDGRMFAVYYVGGTDGKGRTVSENRLMEIRKDGSTGPQIRIPLKHPLVEFFTATPRGGTKPSTMLDLLGYRKTALANSVCYAGVRLKK